jgi:hypothetical protein
MANLHPYEARSGDVLISNDIAVISFLAAVDGQPNVSVSMRVEVLQLLHARITRALTGAPKPSLGS